MFKTVMMTFKLMW